MKDKFFGYLALIAFIVVGIFIYFSLASTFIIFVLETLGLFFSTLQVAKQKSLFSFRTFGIGVLTLGFCLYVGLNPYNFIYDPIVKKKPYYNQERRGAYFAGRDSNKAESFDECLKIPERYSFHYECVAKFINSEADLHLCTLLETPDFCYHYKAWDFKDYKICEKIEHSFSMNFCLKDLYQRNFPENNGCEQTGLGIEEKIVLESECYIKKLKSLE